MIRNDKTPLLLEKHGESESPIRRTYESGPKHGQGAFTEATNWSKNIDSLFENLMTVEQVAEVLGLAPQTIRNWVALRQIPFIRIGGKTRFRKRTIEAWIEQKEFKPCQ